MIRLPLPQDPGGLWGSDGVYCFKMFGRGAEMKQDFDGFSIELFQEEGGDWAAYFEELPNVSAFGDTPENALEELKIAWDLMKESGGEVPLPWGRE